MWSSPKKTRTLRGHWGDAAGRGYRQGGRLFFCNVTSGKKRIREKLGKTPLACSAKTGAGIADLLAAIAKTAPDGWDTRSITGDLIHDGALALLVMPHDNQAPRGRIAVPQTLVLRELLDRHCSCVCTGSDVLDTTLRRLNRPPSLIITDATVLELVASLTPLSVPLSSFSLLMAGLGDVPELRRGVMGLAALTEHSHVLIAEACTHVPREEDLGRVRIPSLLRRRFGQALRVTFARGVDFPEDLSAYDLIIHCGGCMFNRAYMLSRIARARRQGVPITEYDLAQAWLLGLYDRLLSAYT